MISTTDGATRRGLSAALPLLVLAACSDDTRLPVDTNPAPMRSGVEVSSAELRAGDTLRVRIVMENRGTPWASVLGTLHFDPNELTYLGQPLDGPLTLVNSESADRGVLRVISLRLEGLSRETAELGFAVRRPGYTAHLSYGLEEAVTANLAVITKASSLPVTGFNDNGLPADRPLVRPTLVQWQDYLGLVERVRTNVPGAGRVFGDVTLNGLVDGIDALFVANIAVGNRQLLVDPTRDNAIAGDVAPFNLPGLGEAGDPVPPGRNADGTFTISGLDAVAIANEVVGNDRPVAGEPIPGRQPRPFRAIVSSDITTDRTFFRDTVYELHGVVNVPGSVTLTIQAGTLIEGDGSTGARLVIRRGGNINWSGTRLEPIVFTCTATTKTPGCWGGVVINGLSLLNSAQTGGDSLTICPEKQSIGNPGFYGGCLVEDDGGTMRYVRVEYGGMAPAGQAATPGLALLGVGSNTIVDQVQVHGSLGDGLFISGGSVNLRHLVLTANTLSGLRWDDGYGGASVGGSVQFVVVQQAAGGGDGIHGSNSGVDPNAGPRSRPQLYNVTVVGAGIGGGSGRGIAFENGSGGALRNAIVMQTPGAGLEIIGTATCNQTGAGNLELDHSIFFGGTPDFSADNDCVDEAAFATEPVRQNRVIDPGLLAAGNTLTPDWRPAQGSTATSGFVAPPSNLFFDVTVDHVGAVEIADLNRANVPWYAGWTRGWTGAP